MPIKPLIRTIPHHPKPGVMFRDITTLLKDPAGFRVAIDALAGRYRDERVAKVAGIEARGFIVAAPIAYALGAGFVPLRKRGRLPAATVATTTAQYGTDGSGARHAIAPATRPRRRRPHRHRRRAEAAES
jgi:adenine phosphoribosyltransferase